MYTLEYVYTSTSVNEDHTKHYSFSSRRQPVQDILVTFLQQTDHQVALAVLQLMAFGDIRDRPADVTCVRMSDRLHFALTATGDVVATTKCASLTQRYVLPPGLAPI